MSPTWAAAPWPKHEAREISSPPTPPRWVWSRTKAVDDFPMANTSPLPTITGGVDRSRSEALSLYQVVGAKYCSSCMVGDSSRTPSLSS
jgi:hypothetical protein